MQKNYYVESVRWEPSGCRKTSRGARPEVRGPAGGRGTSECVSRLETGARFMITVFLFPVKS